MDGITKGLIEDENLVDEVIVSLVWGLPDNATITIGQIKELAPQLARIVERKRKREAMDEGSFNSYEMIRDHIKTQFPNAYLKASQKCSDDNCQSMPTILNTAIDFLADDTDIGINEDD